MNKVIRILKTLGIVPIKKNSSGEVSTDFLNIKFLGLVLLNTFICGSLFCIIFGHLKTFGILEIITMIFSVLDMEGAIIFTIILGFTIQNIGPLATDFEYKVRYTETSINL